jgi:hypothetical protein
MSDNNTSDYIEDNIYHYTTTPVAIEHILHNKKFRFSSLTQSNDPIEFENFTPYSICDDSNQLSQNIEIGKSTSNIIKKSFKFASFCTDDKICDGFFGKGFQKCRMWSQYADKHRGICLVFSKKILLYVIKDNLDNKNSYLFYDKINYDNKLNKLFYAMNFTQHNITTDIFDHIEKFKKELLFTKVLDYKDESEFRIAFYNERFLKDNNSYIDFYFKNSIKEIIVGCKFSDAYKINIKKISNDLNVPVYQLNWLDGKPVLDEYIK